MRRRTYCGGRSESVCGAPIVGHGGRHGTGAGSRGIGRGAGYAGYVGIGFGGERLPERGGIAAAKALLERLI